MRHSHATWHCWQELYLVCLKEGLFLISCLFVFRLGLRKPLGRGIVREKASVSRMINWKDAETMKQEYWKVCTSRNRFLAFFGVSYAPLCCGGVSLDLFEEKTRRASCRMGAEACLWAFLPVWTYILSRWESAGGDHGACRGRVSTDQGQGNDGWKR